MEGTQQYIQYKYGEEAGHVAKEHLPAAQDMLNATLNFSRLGARAFISKTAKKTASVYLKSTMAGMHPEDQAAGHRVPLAYQQVPVAGYPGAVAQGTPAALPPK